MILDFIIEEFVDMRKNFSRVALCLIILTAAFGSLTDKFSNADRLDRVGPVTNFGTLPLSFEPNNGQVNGQVKFLARGSGFSLFLTSNEAILALQKSSAADQKPNSDTLRMKIVGANRQAKVTGENLLTGKTNYLLGGDPDKWMTDIANFGGVRYEDVYDGIDLVYYGSGGQLEYDFVVGPGATPSSIGLEFSGAGRIEVDAEGDLVLSTTGGEIRLHKPVIYQEIAEQRRSIDGQYVAMGKNRIGFSIPEYDHSLPLVIDPVLSYSTYLGGNGNDQGNGIAVDTTGNTYITGQTGSTNFPTLSPFQAATGGGGSDVFVTKLNANGNALIYSTYLGGSSTDFGNAIAVDTQGNAYITGRTDSTNFPLQNALQGSLGGGTQAFVAKLNSSGNGLDYSTYLGGTNPGPTGDTGLGTGYGIAVDAQGSAYVTGFTTAANFPTVNAFQPIRGGSPSDRSQDAFVTKFNPAGNALIYSTYLGGSNPQGTASGVDTGFGIAIDTQGNAYVSGTTSSTTFPTANPFQATLNGTNLDGQDAFVTKLNPQGNALVFSTYLGGSDRDNGYAIAVSSQGNAYVTGSTFSTNFPLSNPIQGTIGGGAFDIDAYVTKLNTSGNALVYSTYLGGNNSDQGNAIKVDSQGSAHIAGRTISTNFPTATAFQATLRGSSDAFVTKLTTAGNGFAYSTYFGGTSNESALAIALDDLGNAYFTGLTSSTNLPTMNPFQATHAVDSSSNDAFVIKLSDGVLPTPTPTVQPTPTPTPAAAVTISGRVTTPTGLGLRNATVILTDTLGARRTATTSSFGIYSFDNVVTGQTYTLSVSSKRYRFAPRIEQISGAVSNLDFVGLE